MIVFAQNLFFIFATNSSKPGHIKILITKVPSSLSNSSYIQYVCSKRSIDLIASMSLSPIVLGAISDWIKSNWESWCWLRIECTFSCSVISCTYVLNHGKLSSTFLRSKPITWYCWTPNFLSCPIVYWSQLHGAHPISKTLRVLLVISQNLSCISWSLKALLALYHSFFAFLK